MVAIGLIFMSVSVRSQVPAKNRSSELGPLRKALWEVRAKWQDVGIDLGISMDTVDVSAFLHAIVT